MAATETAAHQAADAWKTTIREQLDELAPDDTITHAVIWFPTEDDGDPQILDLRDSEASAIVSAADRAEKLTGEVSVIALSSLDGDEAGFGELAAGVSKPDPETGQLFKVPKVTIDTTQPTLLNLALAGGITIGDRDEKEWVEFYNSLKAGKPAELRVTVHVAGSKKTHRRDKEGDVDAVVETKSLIVTDVHLDS